MGDKRKPPASKSKPAPVAGNGLKPPAPLSPLERKFWDQYVITEPRLKQSDTMMAFTWTRLAAGYASKPDDTSMNIIRHMNAIGTKLGFAPSARTRMGKKAQRPAPIQSPVKRKRFAFDYFGDGSGGPER